MLVKKYCFTFFLLFFSFLVASGNPIGIVNDFYGDTVAIRAGVSTPVDIGTEVFSDTIIDLAPEAPIDAGVSVFLADRSVITVSRFPRRGFSGFTEIPSDSISLYLQVVGATVLRDTDFLRDLSRVGLDSRQRVFSWAPDLGTMNENYFSEFRIVADALQSSVDTEILPPLTFRLVEGVQPQTARYSVFSVDDTDTILAEGSADAILAPEGFALGELPASDGTVYVLRITFVLEGEEPAVYETRYRVFSERTMEHILSEARDSAEMIGDEMTSAFSLIASMDRYGLYLPALSLRMENQLPVSRILRLIGN